VADFVEYTLDDGTVVVFESAEADLVSLHGGGAAETADGGPLAAKLVGIAKTCGQIAQAVGDELAPDELAVQLGVKIAGELNMWFFAKSQTEATITVTATWKRGLTAS
jgi:hypothetical protein